MPAMKITKIVGRLLALLEASKVTLRQLREAMGLLRYLGTCIPVAKPITIGCMRSCVSRRSRCLCGYSLPKSKASNGS
jgi:hypothetical protein